MVLNGCSGPNDDARPVVKPPKPVAVMTLQRTSPSMQRSVTGSVVPWKTEQIGFEVAGRVAEVIEPNERVVPRMEGAAESERGAAERSDNGTTRVDESNDPQPTPLARLDDEQLRIAVESARANVEVARLNRDANRVTIEQQLPSLIESAEAEAGLAKTEFARISRLSKQNAIARAELDTAQTRVATTQSRVASAKADLAQAKARQLALDAQVLQADQLLSEAKRNLRNAVLFSPFPGQVSQLFAVPGTYVKEGDPVVTVQMMDPMTIEFEVTAADSRRYRRGDMLPVRVADGRGATRVLSGMVYQVDAIADPAARTFTVTLHVRNEIEDLDIPQNLDSQSIAYTEIITPVNIGPMITGDHRLLVVHDAVHSIGGETYVWKVKNRKWGTPSPPGDRILLVEKVPVRITSGVIPFLGKWKFIAIEFTDPETSVDVEHDLITGRLFFKPPKNSEIGSLERDLSDKRLADWADNRVLLHDRRWLLRSGDVAQISLAAKESDDGLYVPMKAVRMEKDETFVHLVERAEDGTAVARRVKVDVVRGDSIVDESVLLRLQSESSDELVEGAEIVVEGTHYLNDGDRVTINHAAGVDR